MKRRLTDDERALWEKVTATVRPIHKRSAPAEPAPAVQPVPIPRRLAGPTRFQAPPATPRATTAPDSETLDSGWDRRISSGRIVPDQTIDLHGHTVEDARRLLYRRITDAEAHGARIILVITGKGGRGQSAPSPADMMPGLGREGGARGAIRAQLPRWLGEDGITARIAAVRQAHPRHGGAGAVYVILKRRRTPRQGSLQH